MSSFLSLFCCCCHRRIVRRDEDADETTHLIPSNLDPTPKMVNVNSQIPFNLHNRAITPHPSLSRSVSLSTGRHDYANVLSSTFDAREPLTVQLRSPPSPLHSERNLASQSNSRSISRTRNHSDGDLPNPILNVRLVNTIRTTNLPQRVGRPRHRAYGSPASTEYPRMAESRETRPPEESARVSAPTAGSSGVSAPDISPLDEICLSWGDSDP
ncbi:hypothetical protein B0H12DRAFT_1068682 [Mycena haematopus]|nr:hypothetical protein B0H12DRAFT_1068682 [Mycena haematopus]